MTHANVTLNLSLVNQQHLSPSIDCPFTHISKTRSITERNQSDLVTDALNDAKFHAEMSSRKSFLLKLKPFCALNARLNEKELALTPGRQNSHPFGVKRANLNFASTESMLPPKSSKPTFEERENNASEQLKFSSRLRFQSNSSTLLKSQEKTLFDEENEIFRSSAVLSRISKSFIHAELDIYNTIKGQRTKLWENLYTKRTKVTTFYLSNLPISNLISSVFFIVLLLSLFCSCATAIPIRWDLGPFSPCTVTCGRGTQNRSVICREMPEGLNQSLSSFNEPKGGEMPDMMCPAPKPFAIQDCSQTACDPEWAYGSWGKCSRTCGRGIQTRNQHCKQKLGTGETVTVPDHYCPQNKSFVRRYCFRRRHCSPKWMISQWKPCSATCGPSFQSRVVFCGLHKLGRSRPLRLPPKRCQLSAKPASRKPCHLHRCATTAHPFIRSKSEEFAKNEEQLKVRLLAGQQASVFTKTIVIIKCLADNHDIQPDRIEWYFGGQKVRKNGDNNEKIRVSVLEDGRLRIIRARLHDSGIYICTAGSFSASSSIKVIPPTETDELDTPPVVDHGKSKVESENLAKADDTVNEGGPEFNLDYELEVRPRAPFVNTSPLIRVQPPPRLLQTPPPLSENLHPQLSFLVSRPIVQVRPHTNIFSNIRRNRYQNQFPRQQISSQQDQSEGLVASILQFMADEEEDRSSSGRVSTLLDQVVEISSLHDHGEISKTEKNRRSREILAELNLLLDSDRERVTLRGNIARSTKVVRLQQIVRILEDQVQFKPAAIIPQPTLAPLQLGRDVTAYVGGHLMVADAKRITILCEASGIPVPKITWYRNGNKLPEHERQFVLREGSLRLLYPQLSDSGVYECIASNPSGNASSSTDLSVMKKPRILSTTSTFEDFTSNTVEATVGSDIRAKLGARVIIRCPAEGHPDPYVVWRKDASGLGQNTNVLADNSLEIYPATAAYQGLFGCEASNPAGSDYQASSLVLVDPPRISEELNVLSDMDGAFGLPELLITGVSTEHYDVKANSTVMMGCPVTGFPAPRVTWFLNDQPLDHTGSNFQYQLMKEGKILQIAKADYSTEGTYSCLAQNDGGNFTTRLRLNLIVYSYHFGELSPCSASCGGSGLHFRQLKCMQDGVKEVQEWYCTGLDRPTLTMLPCNQQDCPPRFVAGTWSSCSVSCGNGTRSRTPSCVILMSDGSSREVAAEECLRIENITVDVEPCFERSCPEWKTEPWKSCSRKCVGRGVGWKARRVYCADSNGKRVNPRKCHKRTKPKRKSLCPNFRCQPIWVTSRWSVCSTSCGDSGIKTRIVNCLYKGRKSQPAGNRCSDHHAPVITLPCNRKRCLNKGRKLNLRNIKPSYHLRVCKDKYAWCSRAKRLGLCSKKVHYRSCCQSCRNSGTR